MLLQYLLSYIEPIPANTIREGTPGSQYFQSEPKLLLSESMAKTYKHVEIRMAKLSYKNLFVNGISLYSTYYLFLYSFFQKKEIQHSNKYLTTACPSHNGCHHASFICRTHSI